MNEAEIFHRFNDLSAEYYPQVVKLYARIDAERRRLGFRIWTELQSARGEQEAFAKGFALLRMELVGQSEIPRVLRPWVSAHGTNNAFSLMQGIGENILQRDPESAVGKTCRAVAKKFGPIARLLSESSRF